MNTQKRGTPDLGMAKPVADPASESLPRVGIEEIGRRIKTAREGAKLSQQQLTDAIGVHVNTLGKIERGTTVPDAQVLLDIGRVTNVAPEWLLVGGDLKSAVDRGTLDSFSDLVLIPTYNVNASAGDGVEVPGDEEVVGRFAMPRRWLSAKGLNQSTLVMVTARGDSMEPTVRDGDILLVDRNVARLSGDGIYLMERDNDLFCKRLQKGFDGGVTIMSDNTRYAPQHLGPELAASLNVIGLVVWIGGER
jgi:phage repressor protein C with HTH and peptisase S24 domain